MENHLQTPKHKNYDIIIIGGACLAFGVFLLKNDQLINK